MLVNMNAKLILLLFAGVLLTLLSGCVSAKMTTTLDIPSKNVQAPLKNSLKYRIDSVSVSGVAMESKHADEVINKALERYPELFSNDTSAVPLDVYCNLKDNNGFAHVAGFIGYMLVLATIPVPITTNNIVEVKVMSGHEKINEIKYELEVTFFLTVFTPLGLIPVPGKSDYKKKSGIMQTLPDYMTGNLSTNIADAAARSIIGADKKVLAAVCDKYNKRFEKNDDSEKQYSGTMDTDSPGRHSGIMAFSKKSFALVAGLGEYKNKQLASLAYAESDTHEFVYELKKIKFNKDNIKILNNKNAAKADIKNCLTQAEGNDLIVFWSGRAYKSDDIYLSCYDSKPQDNGSALSLGTLMETVKNKNPGHAVFILDLCSADGKALELKMYLNKLRTEKLIPKGWVFIVSESPDRKAEKKNNLGNGALTYCLLRGLRGKADGIQDLTPKDGKITFREIYNYLSYEMPVETGQKIRQTKYATIITNSDDQEIWKMEFHAE